jgi:branched-subunit amino acid transport protein
MNKNKKWFKKIRGSYLPNSWQGWLTYIPYLAYLIGSVFVIKSQTTHGWSIFYALSAQWVAATVVMTWVAQHKS